VIEDRRLYAAIEQPERDAVHQAIAH
jgi:hypothetical protein